MGSQQGHLIRGHALWSENVGRVCRQTRRIIRPAHLGQWDDAAWYGDMQPHERVTWRNLAGAASSCLSYGGSSHVEGEFGCSARRPQQFELTA